MLEFLLSLLLLVFSLGNSVALDKAREKVEEKLSDNFPEIEVNLPPQADPESHILANDPEVSNPSAENSDNDDTQNSNQPITQNSSHQADPDTNQFQAYNNRSETIIEKVANVAIENSPALDFCSDDPTLCQQTTDEVEPTPTPTLIPPVPYIPPQVNPIYSPPPPCSYIGNHPLEGKYQLPCPILE